MDGAYAHQVRIPAFPPKLPRTINCIGYCQLLSALVSSSFPIIGVSGHSQVINIACARRGGGAKAPILLSFGND
jgi:hypothetical protein